MEKKSILSRIGNIYNNLEEYLLVVSLVINVLLVFLQVIMRTVFKNSLTWSEELSRYIFIWQIWLGASIALKYNEHIRVTLIYSFLKNKKVQAALGYLRSDYERYVWKRCGRYLGLPDVRTRHPEDGAGGGLHQSPADARRRRERRRSDRIGARRRHDPQSRAAAFRVRRNAL